MILNQPHFNFALIPASEELSSLCVELARSNCASHADEYLLGADALPHVTLCQFNAPEDRTDEIWNAFRDICEVSLSLSFRNVYVQFGKKDLAGKCWVGLSVRYEESLLSLQKLVFNRLADLEIEGRNPPADYFPHLTFARCDASRPTTIYAAPTEDFWSSSFKFIPTIGASDEHGRYHNMLYPQLRV